jgi:5-methylthioadenosine/S-adenosylhomocysteine deaminase
MQKADYIIRADYLLTMEGDLSVINDGAVAVAGSEIADVGLYSDISSKYTSDRVLEGADRVVFPGLINTHNHAAMVYFRGLADDLPLMEWLEKHIWPAEFKWLTAEFVDDAIELACLEMLKAGVTTYIDMYLYQGVAAQKVEKIGMRGVLCSGIIDFPWKDYAQSADDYFVKGEEHIKNWNGNDLITPGIAPHATFTCSPENYMRAKELAEKYDVPLHTHLAETEFEVAQCKERYGKSPVEHLDSIGFLSDRVSAAHCVWLTDKEIETLAAKKVGVAHCMESNLKLASGIAPVPKMIEAGVKVALGTDGAASNNDLGVLGELSTAANLLMATKNGADILGLGDITGSLKPGKKADLVIADLRQPHLLPMYDIYSHIAYCMRSSDIDTVMVNGKIVVENRKATTLDEENVLHQAKTWQNKIQNR